MRSVLVGGTERSHRGYTGHEHLEATEMVRRSIGDAKNADRFPV